ncbi:uncharacterized protein LOC134206514 [Armigeres subalbatus]|uniref:uncharacterized protein LOC134206514 n=1 Tax=Armigeres subalbatus TaxID=124917 RepID=UPI002ED6178C
MALLLNLTVCRLYGDIGHVNELETFLWRGYAWSDRDTEGEQAQQCSVRKKISGLIASDPHRFQRGSGDCDCGNQVQSCSTYIDAPGGVIFELEEIVWGGQACCGGQDGQLCSTDRNYPDFTLKGFQRRHARWRCFITVSLWLIDDANSFRQVIDQVLCSTNFESEQPYRIHMKHPDSDAFKAEPLIWRSHTRCGCDEKVKIRRTRCRQISGKCFLHQEQNEREYQFDYAQLYCNFKQLPIYLGPEIFWRRLAFVKDETAQRSVHLKVPGVQEHFLQRGQVTCVCEKQLQSYHTYIEAFDYEPETNFWQGTSACCGCGDAESQICSYHKKIPGDAAFEYNNLHRRQWNSKDQHLLEAKERFTDDMLTQTQIEITSRSKSGAYTRDVGERKDDDMQFCHSLGLYDRCRSDRDTHNATFQMESFQLGRARGGGGKKNEITENKSEAEATKMKHNYTWSKQSYEKLEFTIKFSGEEWKKYVSHDSRGMPYFLPYDYTSVVVNEWNKLNHICNIINVKRAKFLRRNSSLEISAYCVEGTTIPCKLYKLIHAVHNKELNHIDGSKSFEVWESRNLRLHAEPSHKTNQLRGPNRIQARQESVLNGPLEYADKIIISTETEKVLVEKPNWPIPMSSIYNLRREARAIDYLHSKVMESLHSMWLAEQTLPKALRKGKAEFRFLQSVSACPLQQSILAFVLRYKKHTFDVDVVENIIEDVFEQFKEYDKQELQHDTTVPVSEHKKIKLEHNMTVAQQCSNRSKSTTPVVPRKDPSSMSITMIDIEKSVSKWKRGAKPETPPSTPSLPRKKIAKQPQLLQVQSERKEKWPPVFVKIAISSVNCQHR